MGMKSFYLALAEAFDPLRFRVVTGEPLQNDIELGLQGLVVPVLGSGEETENDQTQRGSGHVH